MTEKEQIQNQIQELQEKLQKLEEVENKKMEFEDEGRFHSFHYNGKSYHRLEYTVIPIVWWFVSLSTLEYPIPVYEKVMNSELNKKLEELYQKQIVPEEPEPSMINCVITGNPPDGYVTWQEWYNELGSKGILHKLRISAIDSQPTPEEPEVNEWKIVALEFGKKFPVILPYSYDELSPEAWFEWVVFTYDKYMEQRDIECGYTPKSQTLDQVNESLRKAFVKVQQTEKWKEIQKLIDEEDNDKNFKNSLDLIKEWGENNKPKSLYQICMEWWDEVFVNEMDNDICVDVLVSKIDKEFIPPSSKKNGYEWEKCLKMMRDKLR